VGRNTTLKSVYIPRKKYSKLPPSGLHSSLPVNCDGTLKGYVDEYYYWAGQRFEMVTFKGHPQYINAGKPFGGCPDPAGGWSIQHFPRHPESWGGAGCASPRTPSPLSALGSRHLVLRVSNFTPPRPITTPTLSQNSRKRMAL